MCVCVYCWLCDIYVNCWIVDETTMFCLRVLYMQVYGIFFRATVTNLNPKLENPSRHGFPPTVNEHADNRPDFGYRKTTPNHTRALFPPA